MKNIVMNINTNTKNNRIEIIFSERPSKAVRDAIKTINFVYRNIDGQTMWLCTAKYLDKDAYNNFIETYCKDFKKVVTKDGKAIKKKSETKTEKPAPKKPAAKTETKAKPKLEAKTKVIDNSNANAPKSKVVLTVNGKVVR